nr:F-box/FBD/LRR-repeat protein At4g26340-like [Tanacetum cinerariifolium]
MASSSRSNKSINRSNGIDNVNPDRISDMPDNVISNILSLLPTKNQVVTSCVSTKLKPFRASITNLDFDDEYYPHQTWSEERSERFRQFVTNVLASQEPYISVAKFHLSCTLSVSSGATPVDIHSWVSGVVSRSLKELYLQILGLVPVTLLHSVFQCPTLVNLILDGGKWGKIVINLDENIKIQLPKLKMLQLICVNYANDACVTRLFQGCPELQEVVVERHWDSDSVSAYCISGPKLRKVTVISALMPFTQPNQVPKFGSLQISCPMLEYICLWNYFPYDLSVKHLSGITEAFFHMTPHDSNYAHKLLNIVRGLTS